MINEFSRLAVYRYQNNKGNYISTYQNKESIKEIFRSKLFTINSTHHLFRGKMCMCERHCTEINI